MSGMLRKILRAAVAQPWEYIGEGAPDDWEFRVSPDEETVAIYSPEGGWKIFSEVVVLAEATTKEMDRNTRDWGQFLRILDEE